MELDFFYLGVIFFIVHELDAMRCREWEIFPILSKLPENKARKIFIVAHIPLFYLLFMQVVKLQNESLQQGLNYFLILHLVAHLLLLKHPKNAFKDVLSWSLIVGAALSAGLALYY
jgi:hypothetical protein